MTDDTPDRNLLARETSPYLLQHKDNPVHWMPWGEEAFRRAREQGRPILLSIGYAACHWCHVMAHESFEDEATAALMNELFVNVKVDREERPDLDQIYQHALALLGQHGGWPLTMFLTHDGEPFWGGTYFPPQARYGRPGFPDVLRGIAAAYRDEPDKVAANVGSLREALDRMSESRPAGQVAPAVLDQVADRIVREVDPVHGGIGTAPKFPQCGIFELLWRAWARTGRAPFRTAVETTLTRMCQGGIYDHLGGGFARYSTDARWLVPHFEKMLYDNAEMVDLLTLAWQGTGDALYAERVRETVGWVLREMIALDAEGRPTGAFASTLDADSEGVEGKFYVWTEEEIDRLLGTGPDATAFKRAYDVGRDGNWEGRTILNRSAAPEFGDPAFEEDLARMRAVLARAREERIRPGWDDKVLADWNGLMIAALANAGFAFAEAGWTAAAVRAFDFVAGHLGAGGRLHHGWRRGVLRHPATLDDHANMIRAALALFETTGEDRFLERARGWAADLDRYYWDADGGGYFYTAADAERLLVRVKSVADQAVPSGNGTMVGVLARLHHLTGESLFRDRAEALVAAFSGELTRNFLPLATFLNGIETLQSAQAIVIVGRPDDPGRHALLDVVRRTALPNRVLTVLDPGASLPPGHPAHGKGTVGGAAAAYVCENMTCSAPATDPAQLAARLAGPAA